MLAAFPLTALSGDHGHGKHGEYKDEYWDGNCKIKRKMKKNGDYEEKRKCKDEPQGYYSPQPVYVPAPQPAVQPGGVTVQGTFRLP